MEIRKGSKKHKVSFASKRSKGSGTKPKLETVYEVESYKKYNILTDDIVAQKEFSNCKCSVF